MADLEEALDWAAGVYQIEQTDPVVGGPPDLALGQGIANVQAQQLADRTGWLKAAITALQGVAVVQADIDTAIAALLDGAPVALDTLNELATALGDNDSELAAIITQLALKLDAASYTAADVLAKMKTVDGTGSGLDADMLDGQQGSYYQNAGNLNSGLVPASRLLFADQATAEAGTDNTKLMTALRTKQEILKLTPPALGVGQTWQDVTANRTIGVLYTNTTGRNIVVMIAGKSNTTTTREGFLSPDGGTTIVGTFAFPATSGGRATATLIVPDGYSYGNIDGNLTAMRWAELRT